MVLEAAQLLLEGGGAGQRAGNVAKDTGQGAQFGHRRLQEGIFTLGSHVTMATTLGTGATSPRKCF